MEEIVLAVVLTSGNIRQPVVGSNNGEFRLVPGRACRYRLNKAAKFLRADRSARLAIVGGYRDDEARREAVVAELWFIQLCPDLEDCIVIVDARAKYTVADLKFLLERMVAISDRFKFKEMALITHPDHSGLVKDGLKIKISRVFKYPIPVTAIPSGEPAPYSKPELLVRRVVHRLDPLWERWLSYPLRLVANNRDS